MSDILKKIQQNWKSGITVSFVSIPLALALAIASGATPMQGLITAFWAGLIGSFFGGSHFNIIGPTGALAGVLISFSLNNGAQYLPFVALLSGIMILIIYFLHLDRYIIFIPKSVVYGFMLGIALILGFGQINSALGISGLEKSEYIIINLWNTFSHISQAHWGIFISFCIGTVFIFLWNKKFPSIPGAVILTFFSIGLVILLQFLEISSPFTILSDQYPSLSPTLFEFPFFHFDFTIFSRPAIWITSLVIAIISVLETLLSGQIAENITKAGFNRPKEVLGLALANIVSGIMGGIPATAALARTALNIKSGATNRTSGVINAFFIGGITLLFLPLFSFLPLVVIASILGVVALGMIETKHFIHLLENEKIAFAISFLVAFIIVIDDPITGILVGTVIALLIFVNKVSYGQTEILLWKNGKMQEAILKNNFLKRSIIDSDLIVYKISGTLTYINMPAHLEVAKKIKGNNYVIISLRHSFYADTDGIDYLGEIITLLKENNSHILISGINEEIKKIIKKQPFYKKKLAEGKIYTRTSEAIQEIMKEN